jgi:hypothetical protein
VRLPPLAALVLSGALLHALPDRATTEARVASLTGLAASNPSKRLIANDWLQPEKAKAISDVLIAVWRDAEENDDEATVEKVKAALDFLDLPWVSL